MRFIFYPVLACSTGILLFAGCGKPAAGSKTQATVTANATPATEVAAGPGLGEKVCFECKGEGTVPCLMPGCKDGWMDCPGPCLKPSRGTWTHMAVAGHPATDLWITFATADGGTTSWNQNHVGDVITYQNGNPVDAGKCKICGGTGKVKCDVCKGAGKLTCPICNGKKFIPVAWTPSNNPYFDRQPDVIRLVDGRVVLGRVAAMVGDDVTIVLRDKKLLHVKAADIPPKADPKAPASPVSPAK